MMMKVLMRVHRWVNGWLMVVCQFVNNEYNVVMIVKDDDGE